MGLHVNLDMAELGMGTALSHHHNDLRPSIICVGPKGSVVRCLASCRKLS